MHVQDLIKKYQLQPHPEGGWYKETYRSREYIAQAALPGRFSGSRPFSTAIYFLLEQGNFSAFHKIQSDECWHFYAGQALEILVIDEVGSLHRITLGSDAEAGELFQYVVPAGCWFASRPAAGSRFCFVGCTVAPGFDFADFELAGAAALTAAYPEYATWIQALCRLP
ncbi:MAG TPA: cupin domain-containing protein [Ferruginibacter sp.]|nr:cupin domain-containing protein [Ferruginibacter sp.]HMP19561.1 cupin domain-containing protein [Ferruginibacter sp.]